MPGAAPGPVGARRPARPHRSGRFAALGAVLLLVLGSAVSACADRRQPAPDQHTDPRAIALPDTAGPASVLTWSPQVSVTDGEDWSLPDWVRPAPNSGFFSEDADAAVKVHVRSVDLSWRQLQPRPGALDSTATGSAQGLTFEGLSAQLAQPGPFWMRVFASGTTWAPQWVTDTCRVGSYGPDDDGQRHLPIWNDCVWGRLLELYRALFVDSGLRADPRLRFVYVPGAFTWAEFDYDIITAAVRAGDLDLRSYLAWHDRAWRDLAGLFGPYAHKLVFTGEDFPFGPFGADDDLLATQAVDAGLGIRTGISELSNYHLSQTPAYASTIGPDGHLRVDDDAPVHDGRRVVAGEHECYNACGYSTDDPWYAVRQSNLKALQLRMNWLYVVPQDSYLTEFGDHWDWVRLSLGARRETSTDAWAALRDAEDTYWRPGEDGDESAGTPGDPGPWRGRPYVRNLERWLVQVDRPGAVAHRSDVDVHVGVLGEENGTAREGLSTAVAAGDTALAFTLDPAFARTTRGQGMLLVTFLDRGRAPFVVTYPTAGGTGSGTATSPPVPRTGSGRWRTARVPLPGWAPTGTLAGPGGVSLRVELAPGDRDDLVVRFVRLVRLQQPAG